MELRIFVDDRKTTHVSIHDYRIAIESHLLGCRFCGYMGTTMVPSTQQLALAVFQIETQIYNRKGGRRVNFT